MTYTTNQYCTLADVHNALKLPSSDQTDDAYLNDLIFEAQEAVDDFIGHSYQTDGILAAPATRVFDGYDQNRMLIGEFTTFTQVLETSYVNLIGADGVQQNFVSQQLDISGDCVAGPYDRAARGLPYLWIARKSGLGFLPGTANYTVLGVFGNPTVPPVIARATARIATHWFLMRNTNYADVVSSKDGVKTRYNKPLPADVVEMLTWHKRRFFMSRY